ncbi:MAG: hypothetical protein ACI9WU_001643, partial [Myxococcota bacterium]
GLTGLGAIQALLADEGEPARLVDTRRALNDQLLELERLCQPETRSVIAATRRFLTLEAGWRYVREWSASASRVEDLLGFLSRADGDHLQDNAWLMLRLGFELALEKPRVPRRPLLDAAALVFGEARDRKPAHDVLIRLGTGRGETLPEQLFSAWTGLRRRLGDALDSAVEHGGRASLSSRSDGRRLYGRILTHLKVGPVPKRASAAVLYGFGEPLRREAVARWTAALELLPIHDKRATEQLQATARTLMLEPGRADAVLVMTLLATQEAIARRLGDAVRGRAVRLRDSGPLLERSLVLPGGVVSPRFGARVSGCLEPAAVRVDCLNRLVEGIATKSRTRKRPVPAKKPPAKKPQRKKPANPR